MIRIRGLSKTFGMTRAVDGLDLSVEPGECFGLIGPNGAGKTTTLLILATLSKPDAGEVVIGGFDAVAHPRDVRRLIGYMPDIFQSYGELKVSHYLDYYAALTGLRGKTRLRTVARVVELTDLGPKLDETIAGLSRGVKQRLCLAKTLLHNPSILLLDEPASGLDPRARVEIRLLLKELRGMGKTIVISSHILEDIEEICGRIAVMEGGRAIATGAVTELKRRIHLTRKVRLQPWDEFERAASLARELVGREFVEVENGTIRITSADAMPDPSHILKHILDAGIKVKAFAEEEPALSDVFMEITSGDVS